MDLFQRHLWSFFKIKLTSLQLSQLNKYKELIQQWNSKINLTRLASDEEIYIKHFLDSLSVTLAFSRDYIPQKIADVGTGAGLPGIVLKILYPQTHITLIESVQKKARFCEIVAKELGLKNLVVDTRRAERIGQDPNHRERYDLVVSRAVAALPVLAEYLMPLVSLSGKAVALKGAQAQSEIDNAQIALSKMGCELESKQPHLLPGDTTPRFVLVIKKIHHTPKEFPRSTQEILKNPLT